MTFSEIFKHCDLLLKKDKKHYKEASSCSQPHFWTTQWMDDTKLKSWHNENPQFFFCEFAPIERMEQQDKVGSESDSNWKKIYMQISVLSFTLGYDPKLGISQHLRTRYIFFAAAANIETTTSTILTTKWFWHPISPFYTPFEQSAHFQTMRVSGDI